MPKTTIAVVSDLHCGSTLGLCPPSIILDDGGEYIASPAQQWIWERWLDYWSKVAKAKRNGGFYVVLNGDIVEGRHHGTTQILSGNTEAQALVVSRALAIPQKLKPERIFVVRGTEAHAGTAGCTEEGVARSIMAEKDPDTNRHSWWKLRLEIDGIRLDFRHHGRAGYRPWTEGSAVALLANQVWAEHARRGLPWPDVVVRSHVHRHGYHKLPSVPPLRCVVTPAWQLKTAHAHKVATESIADIGGIIITIKDGEVSVKEHLYLPTDTTVWRPEKD